MKSIYLIAGLALTLAVYSDPSKATDQVWIVGGGPTITHAGAQIEFNTSWTIDVLSESAGDRILYVYFGAGTSAQKDIISWTIPEENAESLQPLARIFGASAENGYQYRKSAIETNRGTTEKASLHENLLRDFENVQARDNVFFIFNGHGLGDLDDVSNASLRLWDDTRMTVREVDSLFSKLPSDSTIRFLFPQCFSGSFSRLMYSDVTNPVSDIHANRCGFFAASEREESEGCSPSMEIGDYRDYTTQLFSVLAGKDIRGQPVSTDLDIDGDGLTTMLDAHLNVLENSQMKSIPRSTSEVYLENWQPWFVRWAQPDTVADNVYGHMALRLAERQQLGAPESDHEGEARSRITYLQARKQELIEEAAAHREQARILSAELQETLFAEYPKARYPNTKAYFEFLENDIAQAQSLIIANPSYNRLVELQNRNAAIGTKVLHLDREVSDLEKIRRLRKLSYLLQSFELFASRAERNEYNALRQCEASRWSID